MKKFVYIFLLLILLTGSWVAYVLYDKIFSPFIKEPVSIFIFTGDTYDDVKATLKNKGLIEDEKLFDLLADKANLANNIYPGHYVLKKGSSQLDMIKTIRGRMQTPVKVVLNNVNFKRDFADRIANQLEFDNDELYRFITNKDSLAKYGMNEDNVLCFFIPNTYEFYWTVSIPAFVERMQKEQKIFWNDMRREKARKLGLTENEVYILASIVEKEYKHKDERSKIAGVYINRLKKNMILQADPTVKYALGDLSIKRVLKVHTEYDHPYNTYVYKGLPPGPICMPETSTIDAVLNAEEHEYLYFCAKADMSGYHTFSKNYNDHLNAAKLYHQALNKMKL